MRIHRSARPAPPVGSDETVIGVVRAAARAHPAHPAIIDGPTGAHLSYTDLVDHVDRVAGWLHGDGFRPGQRAAVWAPNSPSWAVFALATMHLGGAVTTLNPAAVEREVGEQVRRSGATVIATIPNLVSAAQEIGTQRVISLGSSDQAPALAELSTAPTSAPRLLPSSADDLALLPYSSGTTGAPKGVMLSSRNLVTVVRQLADALAVDEHDTTLAVAPWFHILGTTAGLLLPLSVGATVVTLPRFGLSEMLDLIARHAVTYIAVPPPVASLLAGHPSVDEADLSSLRLVAVGGAPLSTSVERALGNRLPACVVGQGWGLTETSGALSVPMPGVAARPGTVGTLVAGTELRVVDPATGHDVGNGGDGELWARGPQVMSGYLGDPGATAELVDADGWVHTGDLGHVDPDGAVVIVDRIKDLIKVNAYQVAPAELEAVLVSHPAVADAAVVGEPDVRYGERPVALVVLHDDTDPETIRDWHDGQVTPYKRLARIDTVGQLPRTPSGKLLRRLLRPGRSRPVGSPAMLTASPDAGSPSDRVGRPRTG